MMTKLLKQLILTITFLGVVAELNAQVYRTAEEEIQRDIHCSASNHYAYPGPQQVRLTETPWKV